MSDTTIKLHLETKSQLDQFREYKNESYDEVIVKLVYVARQCRKNPELSQETIINMDRARERIRKGQFLTEEQAKKRLGF